MKIIDLLNKIAKGEEVPKKIKYDVLEETQGYIYTYSKEDNDYTCLDEFNEKEYLFNQIFNSKITGLNDEVEIIEEKEINHCKGYENFLAIDEYIEHLRSKIDELIDEVNQLKSGKDE